MQPQSHLIVLCGPTGIGKTALAIRLAKHLDCEIISADSRQLFREMSIGTAVPDEVELGQVPHHFVHSHSVKDYYNASLYEQEVLKFLEDYFRKSSNALLVGGSGMYIDAVCRGIDDLPAIRPDVRKKWLAFYQENGLEALQKKVQKIDPVYYERVDRHNPNRLLKAIEVFDQTGKAYSGFLKNTIKRRPFSIHKIGLNTAREKLYTLINQRVDHMMEAGLEEEARKLIDYKSIAPLKTVGYKELFQYFEGEISLSEAIQKIKDHSRAYARRQITWFKRDPEIHWFEPDDYRGIIAFLLAEKILAE